MTIELSCASCGGNKFTYPFAVTNDAEVYCEDCGSRIGTIAEVAERVVSQITGSSPPAYASQASAGVL